MKHYETYAVTVDGDTASVLLFDESFDSISDLEKYLKSKGILYGNIFTLFELSDMWNESTADHDATECKDIINQWYITFVNILK